MDISSKFTNSLMRLRNRVDSLSLIGRAITITSLIMLSLVIGCTKDSDADQPGGAGDNHGGTDNYAPPAVDMKSYDIGKNVWSYSDEIVKELGFTTQSSDMVAYLEANFVVDGSNGSPADFRNKVKAVKSAGKKAIGRIYVSAGWQGIDDYLKSRGLTTAQMEEHRNRNLKNIMLTGAAGGGKLYCANSPIIRDMWSERAKLCAEADCDYYSADFQELTLNAINKFAGCFCRHCMIRFERYLKSINVWDDRLTPYDVNRPLTTGYIGVINDLGISDVQYRRVVLDPTNTQLPLAKEWRMFHTRVSREIHDLVINSSPKITVDNFFTSCDFFQHAAPYLTQPQLNFVSENYRYDPHEFPYEFIVAHSVSPKSISVTAHTEGLDGGDWYSPARMKMRAALACAYGVHFMNPSKDDIAGVSDVDGMQLYYQFMEDNNFLIDNFEPVAKVGFVYSSKAHAVLGESNPDMIKSAVECLQNNLPVRAVLCDFEEELYTLPFNINGLEAIYTGKHFDYASAEDQNAIRSSGVMYTSIADIKSNIKVPIDVVSESGDNINKSVNVVPRQNGSGDFAIHLVNVVMPDAYAENPPVTNSNFKVKLRADNFVGTIEKAYYYRPEAEPIELTSITMEDGYNVITIPHLDTWGIIRVDTKDSDRSQISSIVIPETITIRQTESYEPTLSIAPASAIDKSVSWSSTKPAVAKVDSETGVITAISNGTAIIKATAKNGVVSNSMEVNVISAIDVSAVEFLDASYTITATAKESFTARVLPQNATNKRITYSLQNPSDSQYVTLNAESGEVVGIKATPSPITIVATSEDGGKSDSYILTVKAATLISDFTLTTNNSKIVSGRVAPLQVSVLPTNATSKSYTVSVDNEYADYIRVIDPNTGSIAGLKSGTAKIRVTANDGSGVVKDLDVTVANAISYQVGDLYPNYEDAIGIIYLMRTNNNRIISIKEINGKWSTAGDDYIGGCEDKSNGKANYDQIISQRGANLSKYPIFQWCESLSTGVGTKGVDWYIPAPYELGGEIGSKVSIINTTAEVFKEKCTKITNTGENYWSSAEYGKDDGSRAFVSIFQMTDNNIQHESKSRLCRVRAVSSFK